MKKKQRSAIDGNLSGGGMSLYITWLIWIAWVPFFIPTIVDLFQANSSLPHLIISLVGLALFFSIYLVSSWKDARYIAFMDSIDTALVNPIKMWFVLPALLTLSIALILFNRGAVGWFALFYYMSGYAGVRLSIERVLIVGAVFLVTATLLGLITHIGLNTIGTTLLFIVVITTIVTSLGRIVSTSQKLRAARGEIARLAVTAERLRIARDLHDLLGHNLSLITLKSELAGRLLSVQPERAASEIRDIEQVARTTLQEVREAVSSYRQPGLKGELSAASDILAAAGISYLFEGENESLPLLPPTIEAILSWVVREGVTNVIKHSNARQCTIRLERQKFRVSMAIINDGVKNAGKAVSMGNGLHGLTERVVAQGGEIEALSEVGAGFRLVVHIPLPSEKNREAWISSVRAPVTWPGERVPQETV